MCMPYLVLTTVVCELLERAMRYIDSIFFQGEGCFQVNQDNLPRGQPKDPYSEAG